MNHDYEISKRLKKLKAKYEALELRQRLIVKEQVVLSKICTHGVFVYPKYEKTNMTGHCLYCDSDFNIDEIREEDNGIDLLEIVVEMGMTDIDKDQYNELYKYVCIYARRKLNHLLYGDKNKTNDVLAEEIKAEIVNLINTYDFESQHKIKIK